MKGTGIALPSLALWCGALAVELLCIDFDVAPIVALSVCAIASLVAVSICGVRIFLWHARVPFAILAVACGALIGAGVATTHLNALNSEPLHSWVRGHESIDLIGIVESEGKQVQSTTARLWQQEPQVSWNIATSSIESRGEQWRLELPLSVKSSWQPPPIGSLVQVHGKLSAGEPPLTAAQLQATRNPVVLANPGFIDASAHALRAGLQAALAGRPVDSAALVAGLAIGEQSMQPQELKDALRMSGLSHLTAVSGGNLAIVIVVVVGATRLLRLRLPVQIIVTLIALTWFVILVRPQPSVLRAGVMASVVLVGMFSGGQRRGIAVLAVSIALLIVVAPELAISWGFALSVGATAGLIVFAPTMLDWIARTFPRMPARLQEGLAVTLTAQLATVPIIIAMGSTVGLAGIPANLLAMPVVPLITILGLLAAMLSVVFMPAAVLVGMVASWCAVWIANVAFTCANFPFAVVPWPAGIGGAAIIFVLSASSFIARKHLHHVFPNGIPSLLRWGSAAIAITLALFITFASSTRRWLPTQWALVACDVGQGDGVVLRTGESSAMVIDVGLKGQVMDRCLDDLGITVIDALVITHFHADHVGGLRGALQGRQLKAAFTTPLSEPAHEATDAQAIVNERGVQFRVLHSGTTQQSGSVSWKVLWPSRLIDDEPNNASIVLVADAGGLRFVLPGDIEPAAQSAVIAENPSPGAQVAKVPHHGSRYQDPAFARWTGASLAFVSVGEGNSYGHPAASTVANWQAAGAQVARTDEQGSLAIWRQEDGSIGLLGQRG